MYIKIPVTSSHNKGGDIMVDNELLKAMSDLLDQKLQPIKDEMQDMNQKVTDLEKNVIDVKADLKQTERVLKNEIRKECGLVLDEVERVHEILDKHKADKSAHTA